MPDYQEIKLRKLTKRNLARENRKRELKNKRIREFWVPLLLFLGSIYSVFKAIDLLHNTFIGYKLPVGSGLIFGLLVSFIFNKDYRSYFIPVLPLMAFFITILLSVNSYFADTKDIQLKEIIIEKRHRYGRSSPHAIIKFHDFKHIVPASTDTELDSMSYGVLTVNKCLFGYYVIRNSKLVKN